MNVIRISQHAYDRAKERLNYKKKSLDRMADIAMRDGIKLKDINNGVLQAYILDRIERYGNTNVVMYGEVVYIFSKQNVLITIFIIPQNLKTNLINKSKKIKKGSREDRM